MAGLSEQVPRRGGHVPRSSESPPATDRLWAAIAEVLDPEFEVSIVDMGLVVEITQVAGHASVDLTFTAMGCPATEMIIDDVKGKLASVPGVDSVDVNVVWDPIWTAQRLTPDGKLAFHEMGIAV